MKLKDFHKKFEAVPPKERFQPIRTDAPPTSLFVIFQRLNHVRAQQRYYDEQEKFLLSQAEEGFRQQENGKSV